MTAGRCCDYRCAMTSPIIPSPHTSSAAATARAANDRQPYALLRPARQTMPVVFASPHSGVDYPPELLAAVRLDPQALRRSEDSFVADLFAHAPSCGGPLLPPPPP